MKRTTTPSHWSHAVYALVRDRRGRVLMLRRSQNTQHFPGCWELPGGKPCAGERIDETVLLEVFDESGLDVTLTGVAGAVEGSVPGVRVALLILEARSSASAITLSAEHDAFQWLPLAEVPALKLRPGFDRFLTGYAAQSARKPAKKAAPKRSSAKLKR